MIAVLNDVLGVPVANADVSGTTVRAWMRREPITRADWVAHDYNVHFSIGVENRSGGSVVVDLEVEGGSWDSLPDSPPLLFSSARRNGPFQPAPFPARTDYARRYAVRIPLGPGEAQYIANTLPLEPAEIQLDCERLGDAGGGRRSIFGRSGQGRDLVAYTFGTPARRPTILVTSGFHQAEPDTLATRALMQWLGTQEGKASLKEFAVVLVPMVNPDGFASRTQGSNAAGVNLYWHFARHAPEKCPEASHLWRLAAELKPVGYIDFHSYTFQLEKEGGPYLKPLTLYRRASSRRAADLLRVALVNGLGTTAVEGFATYAPSTLGAMLTEAFDTVTVAKYHLHLKDGVETCRARGPQVFSALTSGLLRAGVQTACLTPRSVAGRLMVGAYVLGAGWLRPTLGRLRRGQLAGSFTRTALLDPMRA